MNRLTVDPSCNCKVPSVKVSGSWSHQVAAVEVNGRIGAVESVVDERVASSRCRTQTCHRVFDAVVERPVVLQVSVDGPGQIKRRKRELKRLEQNKKQTKRQRRKPTNSPRPLSRTK